MGVVFFLATGYVPPIVILLVLWIKGALRVTRRKIVRTARRLTCIIGRLPDGTLEFLRGIGGDAGGGDAGGGGPVEFCRCTGLFLTRRQGGSAFDTVIRMKMRLDQAFVTWDLGISICRAAKYD